VTFEYQPGEPVLRDVSLHAPAGTTTALVGPSGAGKDSLISFARRRLAGNPAILFARRVITRPSDPAAEAHDTLGEAGFREAEEAGAFALSWRSHGLCYGIPVEVDDTIRAGGVVVANGSRGVVGDIRARYANAMPVLVTVSSRMLGQRLAARGRESDQEIAGRIARNADYIGFDEGSHVIDNSGALEEAGEQLVRLLLAAAQRKTATIM
jgi:ribose 1,5-bisphosphokinase